MGNFAYRKIEYAVWDGTNIDEMQAVVPHAYVQDGALWEPSIGGRLLTDQVGTYVVQGTSGGYELFADETAFRAAYDPVTAAPSEPA